MQQFVRVQQGNAVIPALVSGSGLLDLRPLVADITPETIASGVLTKVSAATLKPLTGEVRYLAPIQGIRQIPATGFNYKKHIEDNEGPDSHGAGGLPEIGALLDWTFRSNPPRPQ